MLLLKAETLVFLLETNDVFNEFLTNNTFTQCNEHSSRTNCIQFLQLSNCSIYNISQIFIIYKLFRESFLLHYCFIVDEVSTRHCVSFLTREKFIQRLPLSSSHRSPRCCDFNKAIYFCCYSSRTNKATYHQLRSDLSSLVSASPSWIAALTDRHMQGTLLCFLGCCMLSSSYRVCILSDTWKKIAKRCIPTANCSALENGAAVNFWLQKFNCARRKNFLCIGMHQHRLLLRRPLSSPSLSPPPLLLYFVFRHLSFSPLHPWSSHAAFLHCACAC